MSRLEPGRAGAWGWLASPLIIYLKTTHVIPSYHAPAERHQGMKMDSYRLMVRQAHHERLGSRSA